jgi:beta-N-acetylhexosaminidase
MAAAYLQGLQQSGKVLGTIKHFPGLGDVGVDPHIGVPVMRQSKSQMEQIDWAPYSALIQKNLAHVVMVTHEIVGAVDPTLPSTLSNKVVTGILRNELGFQGVIMTDSLSMSGITAYTSEYQAAADAIEAGADIVMGAATPEDVSAMYASIKQALSSGALTNARIDDSVRRILMMKYSMGLLSLPSTTTAGK